MTEVQKRHRQPSSVAIDLPPPLPAQPTWKNRLSVHGWLAAVLASGFALRVALSPFGSFQGDAHVMRVWAVRLVTAPLSSFYGGQHVPRDHLPGDLWILWMVAHLYHLFSSSMRVDDLSFLLILKLVPAVADLGIGAVLFVLVRDWRGAQAGLCAAGLFMFNPASIFLTAIWGQWDSVSMLPALLAVWLMLRSRLEWAFPLLTYAALIKPQLALLAVPPVIALGLKYLRPRSGRALRALSGAPERWWRVVVAVMGSAVVFCAVLLPFNVGLAALPTRWNLLSRLSYAWNYRLWTTGSAFNLWNTPLDAKLQPDTQQFWLGLSYNAWGAGLMLIALGLVIALYLYRRRSQPDLLLWACLALTFAAFLLPTRGHERYLFPAVNFAAAQAATSARYRLIYALLTLTFLANLYYIYVLFYPAPRPDFLYRPDLFKWAVSLVNVGLFGAVLLQPLFPTARQRSARQAIGSQACRS